jgi:hypothetical protein
MPHQGMDAITNQRETASVVVKGYIAEDAATPNDEIHVLIPSYDMSRQFGPSTFTPRPLMDNSVMLPARNDPCLVALDEDDNAHIVRWWASDPTDPVNRVTQAELDAAVAARVTADNGLDARLDLLEALLPLPVYNDTTLPAGSPDGTLAIVDMPGGFRSLIIKNNAIGGATSWVVLNPGAIQGTASMSAITSTAGAQWNLPTTSPTLTLPFGGSYRMEGQVEGPSTVPQSILGVGVAVDSLASTGSPAVIGTTGLDTANFRAQVRLNPTRITGVAAGEVWNMRIFQQSIGTFTAIRAAFWAWPAYINGVV